MPVNILIGTLLLQIHIDEQSTGPFFDGQGKEISPRESAKIMDLLTASLGASGPSARAEAPRVAPQVP